MLYQFYNWVLRYVPNPVRGEFVNVGVLVGSNHGDWAIKYASSLARANHLGGDATKIKPVLRALELRIPAISEKEKYPTLFNASSNLSIEEVENMRVHKNNALQLSEPNSAFGDSAQDLAEKLYGHFVEEKAVSRKPAEATRLKNLYQDAVETVTPQGVKLESSVEATFGERHQKFDFLLHKGLEACQLVDAVNFQKKAKDLDENMDAYAYRVTSLRKHGAVINLSPNESEVSLDKDVPLFIIHNAPEDKAQEKILRRAEHDWADLNVIAISDVALKQNNNLAIAS